MKHLATMGTVSALVLVIACGPDTKEDPGDTSGNDGVDAGSQTPDSDGGTTGNNTPIDGGVAGDDGTVANTNTGIVSAVSFFQVIDVPVVGSSGVLAPGERNVPIIADRSMRAVVYLAEPVGGVDVRFDVTTGGVTQSFTTPFDAAAASVIGEPDSAAQLDLPADAIQPDSTFTLTVVDSGGSEAARVDGRIEAEVAPPLRVQLVPYEVDGMVPSTTPEIVEGFRDAVLAVYPVSAVDITVGAVRPFHTNDVGEVLIDVGIVQESSATDPDVYFYGMVPGEDRETFQGSTGSSENGGDNPTRAYFAAGAAFGDELSESTFVHELGHLHQLYHAPCGDPPNTDDDYPHADGTTGTLGFDFRTGEFVPADAPDLMAYCQPRWIGEYHYLRILEHIRRSQTW